MDAETQKGEEGKKALAERDAKQEAYNKVVFANANKYDWAAAPAEGEADNRVVLTSDEQGRFEISGLAYAKDYALEEKTAPEGYAKLDAKEEQLKFEVKEGSYSTEGVNINYNEADETNSAQQIKNKKVTIPQTGGIGSLIFIVAGLALMGVAFVAMKRRNTVEA